VVAEFSMDHPIAKTLLATKIRDIHEGFYASFKVDGYEITIDFMPDVDTEGQLRIYVRLVRDGPGKGSELDIRSPDPDLAVADVFQHAREVIQSLVRKR
jgi:hypothetical protein